jgi:hypothetical protein
MTFQENEEVSNCCSANIDENIGMCTQCGEPCEEVNLKEILKEELDFE